MGSAEGTTILEWSNRNGGEGKKPPSLRKFYEFQCLITLFQLQIQPKYTFKSERVFCLFRNAHVQCLVIPVTLYSRTTCTRIEKFITSENFDQSDERNLLAQQ